jgi:hypothetical protein
VLFLSSTKCPRRKFSCALRSIVLEAYSYHVPINFLSCSFPILCFKQALLQSFLWSCNHCKYEPYFGIHSEMLIYQKCTEHYIIRQSHIRNHRFVKWPGIVDCFTKHIITVYNAETTARWHHT